MGLDDLIFSPSSNIPFFQYSSFEGVMPKLKIDNLEIDVPKGMKVIEAAARLGIIIPRFCYHAGLGPVGACRMCAVMFLEGPVKGVQMSCMVDAQDGMVVSTAHEEAVDFRKHVIEWLMMNHPHDCPVCDEGGHCLLQDMTVSGGHGMRRYLGKKRTYRDQYIGPLVQHEMNRCIHCWRCRRFYQEFAGYRDLGAMQIGTRTYFGCYKDGPLESPFSGNLIDLCPTGVYTDKPSRFTGRRWDFERGPSICIHCSLGCHTIASARYREIVRLEGCFNESVNGYFICDRGRYGFYYASHHNRPRWARINTENVSYEKAMQAAVEKLSQIKQQDGPQSIACLGSLRSSLETQGMARRLCEKQGFRGPAYFTTSAMARKVRRAVSRLDSTLAVSMREIEASDFILVIGADPLNEAPMLALAIRQASRKGASVAVIDPRPVSLPLPFYHLPVSPDDLNVSAGTLVKKSAPRSVAEKIGAAALHFYDALPETFSLEGSFRDGFAATVTGLQNSRHPVIVCGTDVVRETTPDLAADLALFLSSCEKRAGLFYILPGANAYGAALLSGSEDSVEQLIEGMEQGTIRALVVVENDPFLSFPDKHRLKEAMDRLEYLVVADYLPSATLSCADVVLPTKTLFETAGTFVNQEGRAQQALPVHQGGLSVTLTGGGGHPPRTFSAEIPGGDPLGAWQILERLNHALTPVSAEAGPADPVKNLWNWLVRQNPVFSPLTGLGRDAQGVRLVPEKSPEGPCEPNRLIRQKKPPETQKEIEILLVEMLYGTEELSTYSKPLREMEPSPRLWIHAKDAERFGIKNKEILRLVLGGEEARVELCVVENMAPGVIFLPRHRELEWQKPGGLSATALIERIMQG
jgi:NADH-quinone oxidoreductase subunit G